jgi:hypothetical protein
MSMMQFQTIKQYAKEHNLSEVYVRAKCGKDKIPGAFKSGRDWLISIDGGSGKKISLQTTEIFAKRIKYSPMQVRRLIKDGKIKAQLIGRDYLIEPNPDISPTLGEKIRRRLKGAKKARKEKKG